MACDAYIHTEAKTPCFNPRTGGPPADNNNNRVNAPAGLLVKSLQKLNKHGIVYGVRGKSSTPRKTFQDADADRVGYHET